MKKYYIGILGIIVAVGILAGYKAIQPNHTLEANQQKLSSPLQEFGKRNKLLRFGMHVTPDPATNPISPPERFSGFRTALDFEILPGEENTPVAVSTVCDGKIIEATTIEGYGGVIIQLCTINNQPVTVLYGHINPKTFRVTVDSANIPAGTVIAELSPANSPESGETRKHLHLAIHKGTEIALKGYVQTEQELTTYIDPSPLFE